MNDCSNSVTVRSSRDRGGGGGIMGVPPPPGLVPPPPPVVDNTSSIWDLVRSFAPQDDHDSGWPVHVGLSSLSDEKDESSENSEEVDGGVIERGELNAVVRLGETAVLSESCSYTLTGDDYGSTTTESLYTISPNSKFRFSIRSWQKGEFLGSGSLGKVYEGFTDDGLFFAVKEVSLLDQGSRGKQSIYQLEQEISLLSQFEHENIVQYLGTDKDEGKLYIFLELVTKGSLANLYQKYHLGDSQVSAYTRQILNGLKYLHERNVVHRDVKCANILVHANGYVKLADFGLATATKLNDVKSCKGTAFWMAPEVVNRKNHGYGLAADIWSLGCTVLEMLTSQIPYSHLEVMQALFRITRGEPPPIPDSLSRDAHDFILKCLQVNPDNRPTAAQLLDHPFVKRSLSTSLGPSSLHIEEREKEAMDGKHKRQRPKLDRCTSSFDLDIVFESITEARGKMGGAGNQESTEEKTRKGPFSSMMKRLHYFGKSFKSLKQREKEMTQPQEVDLKIDLEDLSAGELFFENVGEVVDSSNIQPIAQQEVAMRGHYPHAIILMRGGLGLTEPPKDEEWENAKEIYLMHNELSELPENPRCPRLSKLFLQRNYKLRTIPPSFFEYMPALRVLNLSKTGIKSLPESLFGLVGLERLFLNGCDFFMMLSPKVGELKHLEVFDLEGTEIIDLPKEIEKLTNLTCFEVSFYGYVNHGMRTKQSNAMIPCGVISALSQLEELNIDVNPDDERWNINVEAIIGEICGLSRLNTLKFYFPRVELLSHFKWNSTSMLYPTLSHFKFIVGHHVKRIISRIPCDVEFELDRWDRCLKYINGDGVPGDIKKVLQHATAFYLDRHTTVKKLSDFGIENMKQLKCCILGECNELRVIIDGEDVHEEDDEREIVSESDSDRRIGLELLEYLNIYYMKNLKRIWEGPVRKRCLILLKSLTLRSCPELTTIFTVGLLDNFCNLEELAVEDCPAIISLVSRENPANHGPSYPILDCFFPNLKRISLHYMPELVSISDGLRIAPKLEWMSLYNCPNLKSLSIVELPSKDLKKINGERVWWEALKWESGRPDYLDGIFVPIETDTHD